MNFLIPLPELPTLTNTLSSGISIVTIATLIVSSTAVASTSVVGGGPSSVVEVMHLRLPAHEQLKLQLSVNLVVTSNVPLATAFIQLTPNMATFLVLSLAVFTVYKVPFSYSCKAMLMPLVASVNDHLKALPLCCKTSSKK